MLLGHNQKQPTDTPPKRSPPWPWRRRRMKSRTVPKHKNSAKKLTCMAVNRQNVTKNPSEIHLQNTPPSGPAALNLFPGRRNKGPPLAELYEMTMFLRSDQLEGKSATSTPCTDRAVWADCNIVFGCRPGKLLAQQKKQDFRGERGAEAQRAGIDDEHDLARSCLHRRRIIATEERRVPVNCKQKILLFCVPATKWSLPPAHQEPCQLFPIGTSFRIVKRGANKVQASLFPLGPLINLRTAWSEVLIPRYKLKAIQGFGDKATMSSYISMTGLLTVALGYAACLRRWSACLPFLISLLGCAWVPRFLVWFLCLVVSMLVAAAAALSPKLVSLYGSTMITSNLQQSWGAEVSKRERDYRKERCVIDFCTRHACASVERHCSQCTNSTNPAGISISHYFSLEIYSSQHFSLGISTSEYFSLGISSEEETNPKLTLFS